MTSRLNLPRDKSIVELTADPECCDGSDEWQTGACPNQCEEIGREYRTRVEAETKTRKTVRIDMAKSD